jgi:prevent-host-death family protein
VKEAGIREARQNLSALIEEVRKGHEVTITDRGKPVARLVPPRAAQRTPFAGATEFRRRMPVLPTALSTTIVDDRADDRLDDHPERG